MSKKEDLIIVRNEHGDVVMIENPRVYSLDNREPRFNKQEIELLIETLELDLNSNKLDGFHRTVYQNILAKLKKYEKSI